MNIPAGGGEEGRVIIHNSVGAAGKSLVGPVFADDQSFVPLPSFLLSHSLATDIISFHSPLL